MPVRRCSVFSPSFLPKATADDLAYMLEHSRAAMLIVHDYLQLTPPPAATSTLALHLSEVALDYMRDALSTFSVSA